jgi:carbonic anhydrase
MLKIKKCSSREDFMKASTLIKDYAFSLDIDLSFQNIDRELSNPSTIYGTPEGVFLLAMCGNSLSGGVGFKRLTMFTAKTCEMKRLFVYEKFRGRGIGKRLVSENIRLAREFGFEMMVLDSLEYMREAIKLYKEFGFIEIDAYYFNPNSEAKYFLLTL